MATRKAGAQADASERNAVPGAFPSRDPMQAGASSPPKINRADYKSVIDFLKSYAPGLTPGMEALMAVPKEGLFKSDDGDGTFFSRDERFMFHDVRNKAMLGELKSVSDEYGLGVYGTSHSFYFVFVDMDRRIIFQEKIFSTNDVDERTWQKIESSLRTALEKTEKQRAEGMIALHDGFTRTFRI